MLEYAKRIIRGWGNMSQVKRFSKEAFHIDLSVIKPVSPKMSARVKMIDDKPMLQIDGFVQTPVFFFGNTEAKNYKPFVAEEIKMAAKQGVHLHTIVVHFPVVPLSDKRDFNMVANVLDYTLAADPEAKLILRIPLYPHDSQWYLENFHADTTIHTDGSNLMTWWQTHHHDDLMKFSDGTTSIPSVASEEWINQAVAALDAGIDYIANHPVYSAHVFGYHLTYGSTGEWFYMDYREKGCDYSECNRAGFAKWLTAKYRNTNHISLAWNRTITNFTDIRIPSIPNEFFGSSDNKVFLSANNRDVIDFYEYLNDINELRIEQVSEVVKIKTAGQNLVMIFYGYNHELPDPKSGHCYLGELLDSGYVDMLASPVSYQDRAEGGVMAYMAPVDSIQQHGVLWMVEDDTRTYRAVNVDEIDSGFNPTIAEAWVTKEIHRRNFASIIQHANGMWWMDLWGSGWLLDEELWNNNRKLIDLYQSIMLKSNPFLPDVAYIINEKNAFYMNNPGKHQHDLIYKSNVDIYRCGLSVGYYTFADAISGRIPGSVKLYIFQNAIHITEDEYTLMKHNLMRDENVLLFNYGVDCDTEVNQKHRYTEELLHMNLIPFVDQKYNTMFCVQESEEIDVLERFASNGQISVAAKKCADYTAVFSTYPTLDAVRIREIAFHCHIHVFHTSNDYFTAARNMICLHALTGGLKKIKLPYESVIKDTRNGDTQIADTIVFSIEANKTAIYTYSKTSDI